MGLGCERSSPSFLLSTMTNLPNSNDLRGVISFYEGAYKLFAKLGADNLENATRRANYLLKVEDKLNTLKDEICGLAETKTVGNAKSKIAAAMRKSTPESTVATLYKLDCSFLQKVSPAWKLQIDVTSPDWEKQKEEADKTIKRWSDRCAQYHSNFLRAVVEKCKEVNLGEDEITEFVTTAHENFKEDYHKLSFKELWTNYEAELNQAIEVIKQTQENKETKVDFGNALPFVKDYTPAQIYRDLCANVNLLGEVSTYQFDAWETTYTNASLKPHKEGYPIMRQLMKKIVGAMVVRFMSESFDAWPTPQDEIHLNMLLSTAEENHNSAEWGVSDATPLLDFGRFYTQLAGVK